MSIDYLAGSLMEYNRAGAAAVVVSPAKCGAGAKYACFRVIIPGYAFPKRRSAFRLSAVFSDLAVQGKMGSPEVLPTKVTGCFGARSSRDDDFRSASPLNFISETPVGCQSSWSTESCSSC